MREQKNIREMSDRELRSYKRALRLRKERRCKALRISIIAIATLCIIVIFSASYGAIKSNANSKFKYYTSITVEAGENLWDIADEYIDYVEVKKINNSNVYSGERAILNTNNAKHLLRMQICESCVNVTDVNSID